MLSTLPELISNVNILRKQEGKRPLTKAQVSQVKEQYEVHKRGGHYSVL